MFQAKQKADKNRQKAEEEYERLTHSQRQEAAQLRREEKRRAEKERLLNEEDPDRARKLEVTSTKILFDNLKCCQGTRFLHGSVDI